MVSELDRAKRALVTLLRRLASRYAVTLDLTRDVLDADVRTAYRKVSRKTHPDRGGREKREKSRICFTPLSNPSVSTQNYVVFVCGQKRRMTVTKDRRISGVGFTCFLLTELFYEGNKL